MGELILKQPLARIVAKNRVTAEDAAWLRANVFADGVVSRDEAEALFAVDRSCNERSAEWVVFFVEAVSDYLVDAEAPKGWISDENAEWLIRAISTDGRVDTETELELLVRCMEKAQSMPARLSAYALRQVELAVVHGTGPLAGGKRLRAGVVTAEDVAMLRRVLYAYSGAGSLSITREEAEVLFDINDKTVEAANDPSWTDLFSKAIAFSLMAASGHVPVERQEALRREEWLDDTSVDVGGFFGRVFAGGLRGYLGKLAEKNDSEDLWRERNARVAMANQSAEKIDQEEAEWLAARIGRDGRLHENELALLRFLKAESPSLHPALQPLLDKVA